MIPVNEPLLDGNEKKYLTECIETGWISSEGPFIHRLETEFARRVGRAHGIAVSNGSVALDVALACLSLKAGDEVIMPTFTIISCLAAVLRAGAVPVLVDADPVTWNMSTTDVRRKVSPRTRAIMVVHIYGLPAEMDEIMEIAQAHRLHVVEDAAEMHGGYFDGRACGSFGELSTFSFYPNKHVTTGEGGMVVTDDQTLAERCRSLRNLCFISKRRFVHEELGWNFRMSNLQAAVGVAQLERLDEFCIRKRKIGRLYREGLKDLREIEFQPEQTSKAQNICWVFGVTLSDSMPFTADEAAARLLSLGVQTRPFFWPMHEQPVARKLGLFHDETYPVAERLGRRGFYLPSGMALTETQAEKVIEAMHELFK